MQNTIELTIGDFEQAPGIDTIAIGGKEVQVKSGLGLTETIGFVDSVATTVLDPETGEYRPELFDFAFDAMVLMYFTNIALPANAGEQFGLVCYTNLCFEVKRNIDTEQLDRLYAAADRKILHMLRCAENTLASKMTDLLSSFEQLRECTCDIYSNVGGAGLKSMVDRLAGMDEAALAKAVLSHQNDADAQ